MDDNTKNDAAYDELDDDDLDITDDIPDDYLSRRRKKNRLLLYIAIFIILENIFVPPRYQLSNNIALGFIRLYQATASKAFSASGAVRCRFYPSCSEYGRLSLLHDGFLVGIVKGTWRVIRCNPFNRADYEDWPYDGAWDDSDKLPQHYLHLRGDTHLPAWAVEEGYYIDKGKIRKAGDENPHDDSSPIQSVMD